MASTTLCHWKQLWRWTTSGNLSEDNLLKVLGNKDVIEELRNGICSYRPHKSDGFTKLKEKYPDQTKLLSVVNILHNYIDVDCFQVWELVKHYLCDISYGTPANALQHVAFVDTRPTFLLPNLWRFYYTERLFSIKLLQYILENKDSDKHQYKVQFEKIVSNINIDKVKSSLINQFELLISSNPPPRKIHNEFSCDTIREEWSEHNLREQIAILQCLLIIANTVSFTDQDLLKLLDLFRKHDFGKGQGWNNLLDEKSKELTLKVTYMEISLFMVIVDGDKIDNLSSWIESTKQSVEKELTKLQISNDHSVLLLTWMIITLQSEKHVSLFETQYQHFGVTALRMRVFEYLHQMLNSQLFKNKSKCTFIVRTRIFDMLNELCNKFDGDGTLSMQPGVMRLCSELLTSPHLATKFWQLHSNDDCQGVVSLWNTALEYFPYEYNMLTTLAGGLAKAGKTSVVNLVAELKSLPVYTELYEPNSVPLSNVTSDDVVINRRHSPRGCPALCVQPGSRATVMERKEGTFIHYRTPYSYWTIFNSELDIVLDRKEQHQQNLDEVLHRVCQGAEILKGVMSSLFIGNTVPEWVWGPCEALWEAAGRLTRAPRPPRDLLSLCLDLAAIALPAYTAHVPLRLLNTGLLPRVLNPNLTPAEYAAGATLDTAVVGSILVNIEQPTGSYQFLIAYLNMLQTFLEHPCPPRVTNDVLIPGVSLVLREVVPGVSSWRVRGAEDRRDVTSHAVTVMVLALQSGVAAVREICLHSLLYTENSLELLNIVATGNEQLEKLMLNETDWTSGECCQHIATIQRAVAVLMLALKLKTTVTKAEEVTPLERLIFIQNKQKDMLKVVPKVTSYINNSFNKKLPVLCCKLLKSFAESFQMSLFASLDMTSYAARVLFLDRLRDEHESVLLKVAILDFVTTCIGKQPGLTEAFFNIQHGKVDDKKEESFEGVLGYMADYLGTVKNDVKLLHSPLLSCIMSLFHALWRNNMQVLVKELRKNPNFWAHMTSPLFNDIQPQLKTYAQIFNVIGIELFNSREKIEQNLKETLETFFDTDKKYLDTWINYIYSFNGRDEEEITDIVPPWLSLLTSWKDFTTIFCKCLPICLNIAHKSKLVTPCLNALVKELDDLKDGRLVTILAELYVIMLANWKEDCFDNRKFNAQQIDNLLANTATVYECLHPRAKKAILSIGTVAISSLDYEIKANSITAQNVIRSVTNINSIELAKLFDEVNGDQTVLLPNDTLNKDIQPVVLALATLEQCLELYDDMFTGLSQWFQTTRFTNKLLCCLQMCLQNKKHYHTSLAALRCLTAYARGPFSKDLLFSDLDQFLWMQLLPPKFDSWKPQEWWRIYSYSLDFISCMLMQHGQYFAGDAVTFVGVHLEHLIEAVLMPRHVVCMDSLNLCASVLHLVVQLVKFETRWRTESINSLVGIMRSISACLYECVSLMLRSRRSDQSQSEEGAHNAAILHRTLELVHMSTLCLLSFSPDLLSLLADCNVDLERWQPLVELHFGAPKISSEHPQLTFGTLLSAVCLLTKALNQSYQSEESSLSRSPRRRRTPPSPRASHTSLSSDLPDLHLPNARLLSAAIETTLTLIASQALLAVRDKNVPNRHKQLIRRELCSELTVFYDFVRKRILYSSQTQPHLIRNKLGIWPLPPNEDEALQLETIKRPNQTDGSEELPRPPPPKRLSTDSMREYILRKHYLDKRAQTPTKFPPSPVSHSTPTTDKKKDGKESTRSSKRVSWAETTRDSDVESSTQEVDNVYSNLTEVQINNDEDYFHFMSVVFLYICQTDL